uniref:Uncharacterized protein n=1 Tax=Glossina brevipalpis TaxID=37001 RepID=A0A1A9X514_9MUSC
MSNSHKTSLMPDSKYIYWLFIPAPPCNHLLAIVGLVAAAVAGAAGAAAAADAADADAAAVFLLQILLFVSGNWFMLSCFSVCLINKILTITTTTTAKCLVPG